MTAALAVAPGGPVCEYIDCTSPATREGKGVRLCTAHAARGRWEVCVLCGNGGLGLIGACTCPAPSGSSHANPKGV